MIEMRHVAVTVLDMERSLRFYRDLLGFKIDKDRIEEGDYIDNFSGVKGIKVRTVKLFNCNIELLQYYSHPEEDVISRSRLITAIGGSHYALTVDNLDEIYEKLSREGIVFISKPQYSPDGYAKLTFCRDPDGVLIELVEVL